MVWTTLVNRKLTPEPLILQVQLELSLVIESEKWLTVSSWT